MLCELQKPLMFNHTPQSLKHIQMYYADHISITIDISDGDENKSTSCTLSVATKELKPVYTCTAQYVTKQQQIFVITSHVKLKDCSEFTTSVVCSHLQHLEKFKFVQNVKNI